MELPFFGKKQGDQRKDAGAKEAAIPTGRTPTDEALLLPAPAKPAPSEWNGYVGVRIPLHVDTKTHMAFLLTAGNELSRRWEEKKDNYQELYARYKETPIALPPETSWLFMRSTATMCANSEEWRQNVVKALNDYEKILKELEDEANRQLGEKERMISDLKDSKLPEIFALKNEFQLKINRIDELEKELERMRHAKTASEAEAECESRINALRISHADELKKMEGRISEMSSGYIEARGKWEAEKQDEISKAVLEAGTGYEKHLSDKDSLYKIAQDEIKERKIERQKLLAEIKKLEAKGNEAKVERLKPLPAGTAKPAKSKKKARK